MKNIITSSNSILWRGPSSTNVSHGRLIALIIMVAVFAAAVSAIVAYHAGYADAAADSDIYLEPDYTWSDPELC